MVLLLFCVLTAVNSLTLRTVDDEEIVFYWKYSESHPCLPFTTFYQQCNHCVCGADGVAYCTKFYCVGKNKGLVDPSTVLKSTTAVMTAGVRRYLNGNRIETSASEQTYE